MNTGPSGLVNRGAAQVEASPTPSHVEVEPISGLDVVSYAKCEDVKSIATERLVRLIGAVGGSDVNYMATILAGLLSM